MTSPKRKFLNGFQGDEYQVLILQVVWNSIKMMDLEDKHGQKFWAQPPLSCVILAKLCVQDTFSFGKILTMTHAHQDCYENQIKRKGKVPNILDIQ